MGRASIHFSPDVIKLIARHGAHLFPSAPYCPLNHPTEYLHSWVKSWLKRNEVLVDQIGQLALGRTFRSVLPLYALNASHTVPALMFSPATSLAMASTS